MRSRDYRIQASREEVARSLEGNWREDVLFELQQAVDSYHFAHRQKECDRKLEAYLASLPTRTLELPAQPESAQAVTLKKKKKVKKPSGNQPQLDLATGTVAHLRSGSDLH
jgi:hypothetical protein